MLSETLKELNVQNTQNIYKEVMANYRRCQHKLELLSDTWAHTLVQKGEPYTFDEMMQMRSPGNRVNAWMVDSLFLVDQTIIDLNNPIVVRLLELGESDFGNPRKDTKVMGRFFSSLYLVDVIHAARIIKQIEDAGIMNPRVMDIGGGSGLLLSLLKRYFGDRITLFFVDIPESLLIQEWYLINSFLDAEHAFKADEKDILFKEGGLNFINAYVLQSQNIEIDVVCNLASMQEMKKESIQQYLRYIGKNVVCNGFFYFSNRFGQSSECVTEPSEYDLDAYWKIEFIRAGYPIEMCKNGYLLICIFRKTDMLHNIKTRRFVLRIIWNSLPFGLIKNQRMIDELIDVSIYNSDKEVSKAITQIFKGQNITPILSLHDNLYFSHDFYMNSMSLFGVQSLDDTLSHGDYLDRLNSNIELGIIRLMLQAQDQSDAPLEQLKNQITSIVDQFNGVGKTISSSEYWTARFAGIFLALNKYVKANDLITLCIKNSDHSRWILRFAFLYSRFGFLNNTKTILDSIHNDLDPFLFLKKLELQSLCGNSAKTLKEALAKTLSLHQEDPIFITEIAKTAIKIGDFEAFRKACHILKIKGIFFQRVGKPFFNIFSLAIQHFSKDQIVELIHEHDQLIYDKNVLSSIKLEYGILLLSMGDKDQGLTFIEEALKKLHDSYFDLGWAGLFLKRLGYNALADDCLERSLELRKGNFMHYEFIGNVYLLTRQYKKAKEYLQKAAHLKPYLREPMAKAIFCGLPDNIRDSGIFGKIDDFHIIFSQDQNFYNDSPNWK